MLSLSVVNGYFPGVKSSPRHSVVAAGVVVAAVADADADVP